MTVVLAIETSCDETAAAVVEDGRRVLSSVVSSQIDLHASFGGVVPEVAGRAHVELLTPVVSKALSLAQVTGREIDAVGATLGPGLIGSLLVGVSAAKAYSLAWGVPFVGVNHMEGHLHAAFLEDPDLVLPSVVLLVSGGHTMLDPHDRGRPLPLARSDDRRRRGRGLRQGGPFSRARLPRGTGHRPPCPLGDPSITSFPRGLRGEGYDFSFSGLKTSVVNFVRKNPDVSAEDVSAAFQEAVVDVLVEKTRRAADSVSAKSICIGGGVAANSSLRAAIIRGGRSRWTDSVRTDPRHVHR